MLGTYPHKRIMAISYASDLAQKLSENTRCVIQSRWFRDTFPACRITSATQDRINTDQHGYRQAGSIGGSILGHGADLIIVDDPIKALDALSLARRTHVAEFYDNTLYTRLNDKRTGAIVIVMQRLHEDDLVGHVLGKEAWEVLSIPAIAVEECTYALSAEPGYVHRRVAGDVLHPVHEPPEILEALRRSMGSLNFSAQYQQTPLPAAGNIVKREWIESYDHLPTAFDLKICSWDTASTIGESSDWSVGMVWGAIGQTFYLIDILRGRWEVPDLRRQILRLTRDHQVNATLIEDTELGRAIAQDLCRTGELLAILQSSYVEKEARMLAQSPRFEAGQVYLSREASWLGS
jgi:predicted phage terminase large subunit-like protein